MTDQHTLHVFITLAEQLHFRKTSLRHHMTTSALSRAIQRLEEKLGTVLFERSKRSVKLTDSGRRFYDFAKQTVTSFEQLQSDLQATDKELIRGTIKLYATVTAAYTILPNLVKRFRAHYPLVTTYLETGAAKWGYPRLTSGEADFTIGIITHPLPADILSQRILQTPLVFIVPKTYTSQTLQNSQLIFPEQGDLATLITTYLHEQQIAIQPHSYVEGHEAILAMVAAGLGTAILPKIVIDNSHQKNEVTQIVLKATLPTLEVGLFVKKSSLASPVKRAFWDSCTHD